jgi:hypothetical protein
MDCEIDHAGSTARQSIRTIHHKLTIVRMALLGTVVDEPLQSPLETGQAVQQFRFDRRDSARLIW